MAAFHSGILIEGDEELRRNLRALPVRIENMVLAKALRAGGNEIRRAVRAATPVRSDPQGAKRDGKITRSPGHLRKSWRVTLKREGGHLIAYVHTGRSGYYGYFLEVSPGGHSFAQSAAAGAQPAALHALTATMRAELSRAMTGSAILAQMVSRA